MKRNKPLVILGAEFLLVVILRSWNAHRQSNDEALFHYSDLVAIGAWAVFVFTAAFYLFKFSTKKRK